MNYVPTEAILEPELTIVDAHHHLWIQPEGVVAQMEVSDDISSQLLAQTLRQHPRYLFDELTVDLNSGHNVRATVYMEANTMYRVSGPEAMRSVGEIEFANGVAAMGASGCFGYTKVCAGIVGGVDLRCGAAVQEVLWAHVQAGGGRYRGVRTSALYDEDSTLVGAGDPHLLGDAKFREGFACLQGLGLSFDALVLEPQLPDVIDLACTFPDTQIVLNHLGAPVGIGRYAGQRGQRFRLWSESIRGLARCANVTVKLGGLGLPFSGFESVMSLSPCTSAQLADEWRPYFELCIETFGVDRCMFESNFPVDSSVSSYATVWNAFKRIAAGASSDEKSALFSGTATRIYRLQI